MQTNPSIINYTQLANLIRELKKIKYNRMIAVLEWTKQHSEHNEEYYENLEHIKEIMNADPDNKEIFGYNDKTKLDLRKWLLTKYTTKNISDMDLDAYLEIMKKMSMVFFKTSALEMNANEMNAIEIRNPFVWGQATLRKQRRVPRKRL